MLSPHPKDCAADSRIIALHRSGEHSALNILMPQCTGYFFTYYNTRITEERKAQIERINEQV